VFIDQITFRYSWSDFIATERRSMKYDCENAEILITEWCESTKAHYTSRCLKTRAYFNSKHANKFKKLQFLSVPFLQSSVLGKVALGDDGPVVENYHLHGPVQPVKSAGALRKVGLLQLFAQVQRVVAGQVPVVDGEAG
jgi:hypothetical protein